MRTHTIEERIQQAISVLNPRTLITNRIRVGLLQFTRAQGEISLRSSRDVIATHYKCLDLTAERMNGLDKNGTVYHVYVVHDSRYATKEWRVTVNTVLPGLEGQSLVPTLRTIGYMIGGYDHLPEWRVEGTDTTYR